MHDRLQLTLTGAFDAPSARTTRVLQLNDPSTFIATGEHTVLIDMSMLVVAAAIPAMAVRQGIVQSIVGLPIHARTRLDLLSEHGRDLGGAVVVGETQVNKNDFQCHACASQAAFSLEIGERLTVPTFDVGATTGAIGVLIHTSLRVHTSRGAELVADVMTRLWNAEATT